MVQAGWQEPTGARVVMRATGPMLNPILWTPEECDRLLSANPTAYQTDVLGEFADPDAGLFEPAAITRNTRDGHEDLPRAVRAQYFAAIDPSDGAAESNPWTLVLIERTMQTVQETDTQGRVKQTTRSRFRTAVVREWRGKRPSEVLDDVAKVCGQYGVRSAVTDQYAGAALTDIAAAIGFALTVEPWTRARKVQAFTDLATLVNENRIELHPDKQFQRDLRSVRKRVTQQAVTIVFPKMGDGRHCDYAPALASAVELANKPQPMTGAYTAIRQHQAAMPKPRE
jgi:hypothetical protein